MSIIDIVLIILLFILVLFKRSRYAASCYLVVTAIFISLSPSFPEGYYFSVSSGVNALLFFMLVKSCNLDFVRNLLKWKRYRVNYIVAGLSLVLILINMVGYSDYLQDKSPLNYNNSYTFIVCLQVAILYIGNMLSAYVDRYNNKLAMAIFLDSNNYEKTAPAIKTKGE